MFRNPEDFDLAPYIDHPDWMRVYGRIIMARFIEAQRVADGDDKLEKVGAKKDVRFYTEELRRLKELEAKTDRSGAPNSVSISVAGAPDA